MKFKEKPVVIEATRWQKNGDHPDDGDAWVHGEPREGVVVRYFRRPDVMGTAKCHICGFSMKNHGWIDTLEGGHIVCPGDFIITSIQGERYPCKPDIFDATYESVEC